ncbi:MAG TPA: hydantoinase/oxoprolinase family protein [Rhizobium sp.]|nr:hydantoinase/oxoprolinase family protein [Rhizobium sp.]
MTRSVLLGIDTGGTYTDAVLFSEADGLLAKAKALTTRHDLAVGISASVDEVLRSSGVAANVIGLVSLSTTLATNALVEGQGGRTCLVMIGFEPADIKRGGLSEALGTDPVLFLPGGHDTHGNENLLDMRPLEDALPHLGQTVSSFAVAGYFAVRNPAHEIRVRDRIRAVTDLPVTCSHELSSKLGGPRRALTTLLNARLIAMIDRLIGSCEMFARQRGISAPMMVVRGDGALISAAEARLRPIETILSGPAASLVGARYLTGLDDAVVSDIGGTTTDVAILDGGKPRLDAEGAVVGGHRTMVEAVAMRTYGLGGDSEVRIDERGLAAKIELGPRRLVPLSLAAALHGNVVLDALERQLRSVRPGRNDGRFAVRTGVPESLAAGLQPQEANLFARIGDKPVPLDQLLTSTAQGAVLDRLVARGLVHLCGITPSDAMHVLRRQEQWQRKAAELGLRLALRTKDGTGRPIAESPEELAGRVVARLHRRSAEIVLGTCLAEDELADVDPARSVLIDCALSGKDGIVRFGLALDRPLVGLGASARVYYPDIAEILSSSVSIPLDSDVANAVGAVVGQVQMSAEVVVTSPQEGLFIVSGCGDSLRLTEQEKAFAEARRRADTVVRQRVAANGASATLVVMEESVDAPEIEGRRRLIEARVIARAVGRPPVATE